jgi:hypothetical protein
MATSLDIKFRILLRRKLEGRFTNLYSIVPTFRPNGLVGIYEQYFGTQSRCPKLLKMRKLFRMNSSPKTFFPRQTFLIFFYWARGCHSGAFCWNSKFSQFSYLFPLWFPFIRSWAAVLIRKLVLGSILWNWEGCISFISFISHYKSHKQCIFTT